MQIKARAEIENREWIAVELTVNSTGAIDSIQWRCWGCHHLLKSAETLFKDFKGKRVSELSLCEGVAHWDLILNEIVLKVKQDFKFPVPDEELCHCRRIPARKVDEAIILGAHTPERVTAWISASSGCGTCRPEVQKIIEFRLKKAG